MAAVAMASELEQEAGRAPPLQIRSSRRRSVRRRDAQAHLRHGPWIRRGREGGGAAAADPAELDAAELEAGGARGGGRSLGVPAREEKGVAWGGRRKGPCGEEVVGREWERGGAGGGAVGV